MTEPYVERKPGEFILAKDWNDMQREIREHIEGHNHAGNGSGPKLAGDAIDPAAAVTMRDLTVTGKAALPDVADLSADIKGLHSQVDDADGRIGSIQDQLEDYHRWKGSIQSRNPVVLPVGSTREFKHPVEAANHINTHGRAGDVLWKIEIDPGTYEFPYEGHPELAFSHFKNVQLWGASGNPADVTFRYTGDEDHYMVTGEFHSSIDVRHISFAGSIPITRDFIKKINERTLRPGMAGGGLAQGIRVRYNSYCHVDNCTFHRLWFAVHGHDNVRVNVYNSDGSELRGGCSVSYESHLHVERSTLAGIGGGSHGAYAGLGAFHNSSVTTNGVTLSGFGLGLTAEWNGDFRFLWAHDRGPDGKTRTNIRTGYIENCDNGIRCYYHSTGEISNALIRNSQVTAVFSGFTSDMFAASDVTIDGAGEHGFYAIHGASIQANDSTVKNCRGVAYYARHRSEIHAARTKATVSNNTTNYSPAASPSNYDSYIHIS